MKPFWSPLPIHPLSPKGGEIFSDYVFSIMDSLISLQGLVSTGVLTLTLTYFLEVCES